MLNTAYRGNKKKFTNGFFKQNYQPTAYRQDKINLEMNTYIFSTAWVNLPNLRLFIFKLYRLILHQFLKNISVKNCAYKIIFSLQFFLNVFQMFCYLVVISQVIVSVVEIELKNQT